MDRKYTGVTARKNGIQLSFMYRGNRIREYFSIAPNSQNMKAVFRRREALMLDIELGKFKYNEHFPNGRNAHLCGQQKGEQVLFEKAANEWLRCHQKDIEISTARDYTSALKSHLLPTFGGLTLEEITVSRINDWRNNLEISPKRINNIMTPLRLILEEAYQKELIPENPTARIKNKRLRTREPEPFSTIEITRILECLSGQEKNLIQFSFASGLRTSELLALTWDNIDFKNNRFYVRRALVRNILKETKTKAGSRSVCLNDQSYEALKAQQAYSFSQNGFVFVDKKNPSSRLNDKKIRENIWTPALKRSGIKYRPPYQARHTFASQKLQEGKSPSWVAAQLGHANASITFSRYARWIPNNNV